MGLLGESYIFEEASWEKLEMTLFSTFMDYVQSMGCKEPYTNEQLNWTELNWACL